MTTKQYPLSNGTGAIPAIGLGTWQSSESATRDAVKHALQHGYRHIDTALNYGNEKEVGEGIRASGLPRDQIWVTTKLDNHWHHRVREGLDASLNALGLDYLDLYLVHFPCSTDPDDRGKCFPDWDFVKTWYVMDRPRSNGRYRTCIDRSARQARHAEAPGDRKGQEYRGLEFSNYTSGETIE